MDDKEEEVVRISQQVKNVPQRRIMFALAIVFILSLCSLGVGGYLSYTTLRGTAEDGTVLAQQIQQACADDSVTSSDLAPFCPQAEEVVAQAPQEIKSDPVPGPVGPTGAPGGTGLTGDTGPAPTDAQVLIAVRSFCTDTRLCRGRDGANVTPAQVAIAVSSYCNNNGECRGAAGTNGVDGQDGADAPPITQAQLISAVDSFCSLNQNCRGQDGTDGTDGTDGADSTVPGPPGVINVADDCGAAPDGQVLSDVNSSYDPANQIITISCSYKDDQVGSLLQNGSG